MSFVVRLDFLVRLDLIFSSSTFIGSLCDMIFLSFNNGLSTSSINILKARRVCGYFFSVNILGTLTHTFSIIFFILMELNHKNTDAFNLWLTFCYTIRYWQQCNIIVGHTKPSSVFKILFFWLDHSDWICWYHIKKRHVDDLSC